MALRTKLNTNDEGDTNGFKELDDLDAVYVDEMKKSGLSDDLMAQFMDISKRLRRKKAREMSGSIEIRIVPCYTKTR